MELAPLNSTEVIWTQEPDFNFGNEVEALTALQDLGEQLRDAREQVRQIMRYMTAAVRAAAEVEEDGTKTHFQALVGNSGLARQTVADMLKA